MYPTCRVDTLHTSMHHYYRVGRSEDLQHHIPVRIDSGDATVSRYKPGHDPFPGPRKKNTAKYMSMSQSHTYSTAHCIQVHVKFLHETTPKKHMEQYHEYHVNIVKNKSRGAQKYCNTAHTKTVHKDMFVCLLCAFNVRKESFRLICFSLKVLPASDFNWLLLSR